VATVTTPSLSSRLAHDPEGWNTVVRRQLFFLLVVSSAVSLGATGRVTPRLVFDAGVSALFMPVCQVLVFIMVWRVRGGRRGRDLAADAAGYVALNTPWLWWWCGAAAIVALVPPRAVGPWILPMVVSLPVFIVWALAADYRWLRRVQRRSRRQAAMDLAWLRGATWIPGLAWFFGIAFWYDTLPAIAEWWRA